MLISLLNFGLQHYAQMLQTRNNFLTYFYLHFSSIPSYSRLSSFFIFLIFDFRYYLTSTNTSREEIFELNHRIQMLLI